MSRVLAAVFLLFVSSFSHAANWPPPSDYLAFGLNCSESPQKDDCFYAVVTWPREYSNAIAGGYQGQRNISYCFSTGCYGAIRKNLMLGCAWRIVIIQSGHLQLDSGDVSNRQHYCGRALISAEEEIAAAAQARRIMDMIKGK